MISLENEYEDVKVVPAGMIAAATRGAAWLDDHFPSWWLRIDAATLDMREADACVCGLGNGHGYTYTQIASQYKFTIADGRLLGFDIEATYESYRWVELGAAWLAIVARRHAGLERLAEDILKADTEPVLV